MNSLFAASPTAMPLVLIALVVGLLLILALGQIAQATERRRRQRQQQKTVLQLRARELQEALEFLAPNLLDQNLREFIAEELAALHQQLHQLVPDLSSHDAPLQIQSPQEKFNASSAPDNDAPRHSTPPQEARRLLRQLHHHIKECHALGRLNSAQAQTHIKALQQGLLQLQLGELELAAEQALAADKPALARHHRQQALTLLRKHNQEGQHDASLARLEMLIDELNQLEAQQRTAATPSSEAWEQLDDESWKKNRLYD